MFQKLILILPVFFFLSSCGITELFEEEEEILQGKRERVFKVDEKKLTKAFVKVRLDEPKFIEDWAQNNQNQSNHLFHFLSNDKLKKKWKVEIGKGEGRVGPLIISPIIYKEIIYTIDNRSELQARDAESGKLIWNLLLNEENKEEIDFIGGLAANNDVLAISTGLGNIYILNYLTGKQIWKKNFLSQISAPPIIERDKIFVITDDNQLLAIDVTSGVTLWNHSGNIETVSILGGVSPAIDNGLVYVTYTSGEIFALNQNNGAIQWYENLGSEGLLSDGLITDIQSPPVIYKDQLYVSSFSGKFVALESINGERLWELNLSILNPITISGDYIYLIDTNNKLYCITRQNGGVVWAVQLKKRGKDKDKDISWVGPLLTSYKLILASSEGTIISLSPFNGKLLSVLSEKESFMIQPIHAKKRIYLVSREGNLFKYD